MKSFDSAEVLQAHFDQVHETENDSTVVSCNFNLLNVIKTPH